VTTWEDTSSYSRGDAERVPTSWRAVLPGGGRLAVHRLIHCTGWYASAEPFFGNFALQAEDPEQARAEAAYLLGARLTASLAAVRELRGT
jgi:hypothetical protein